jgi:hypothetical protein
LNHKVKFQLIDHGWEAQFETASMLKAKQLRIMSPFIKKRAAARLARGKKDIRVLTRFSLPEFAEGVSDLSALRAFLKAGAEVRGIRNLHSKMYLFGDRRSIVTSANLTSAALTRNHELGFVSDDSLIIQSCHDYFDRLWDQAGPQTSLTHKLINEWEDLITNPTRGEVRRPSGLRDYGANLNFLPDVPPTTLAPGISSQAFIKFFGTSNSRASLGTSVIKEVNRSESHWSLSYPRSRRPRQVEDGDVMFIGTLVSKPDDVRIYGRAIAYKHQPGRDEASAADIRRVGWKAKWSNYIRVRDPEFIDGTLGNGISLKELMDHLGASSFASTEQNQQAGAGNIRPHMALRSQPQVRLSATAAKWLNSRFDQAIAESGRIRIAQLETLYWPRLPYE